MFYRLLADLTALTHLAFILFAITGGFLALKWKRLVWIHVPTAVWAVLVAVKGWVCPLTPFENWFRRAAGAADYESTFIEHYLLPVLYPVALTRDLQIAAGVFVLVLNVGVYTLVCRASESRNRIHHEDTQNTKGDG